MASSTETSQHVGLVRNLGLFDITMIGVGAMIGAGIFVLTGIAAGTAGPALILAFAMNGVITVLTAMVYAELGSAIPEAGGGYLWVKEGLPGPNGFLAGWMSWFAHAVAGSLYGVGFGGFIYELLRILFLDPAAHHDEHIGVFLTGPLHLPFGDRIDRSRSGAEDFRRPDHLAIPCISITKAHRRRARSAIS